MVRLTLDEQRRAAGLNPLPKAVEATPDESKPKCQHGCTSVPCRHTITSTDPFLGRDRELRGIPLVGAGGGAIAGSRPGDSTKPIEAEQREARDLNARARRIVRDQISANGVLRKRRRNGYNPPQQNEDA